MTRNDRHFVAHTLPASGNPNTDTIHPGIESLNTCLSEGLHAHWPFLLNTPPKAIVAGPEIPFQELDPKAWLANEISAQDDSSLALSMSLPKPRFTHISSSTEIQKQPEQPLSGSKGYPFLNSTGLQRYIDYVVKEIQLLGKLLADNTRLTYLHWSADMICRLTNSELTQLTYHINRSFPGFVIGEAKVVAELDQLPTYDAHLALLVGLGINSVCINDPGTHRKSFPLPELADWLRKFRSYGITDIYIRLKLTPEVLKTIDSEIHNILAEMPMAILLLPEPYPPGTSAELLQNQQIATAKIRQKMLEHGYSPVTDSYFVSKNHNNSTTCQWLMGLGLGARSYTHTAELINTSCLADYYHQLDRQQLPLLRARKLVMELY